MTTGTAVRCPGCGYENDEEALGCSLCGEVLRRADRSVEAEAGGPPPVAVEVFEKASSPTGDKKGYAHLVLGGLLAPVLAATPLLQYMGWFLASLCHEIGHTLVAWFFGMPAFPAIRLDGHAASVHQDQVMFLVLGVWCGLGWLTWISRERRLLAISLGLVTALYPLFAFTHAREPLFLMGGHLGELCFATICFWRVFTEGFTESRGERVLYAVVGWYLAGRNVYLCGGLVFSASVRTWYASNGSFGLQNDLIRLADAFSVSVSVAALPLLLLSLCTLPAAWFLWRRCPA